MSRIQRRAYAEMFGPTVGDRVRLADTNLVIEVEQDLTLRAGSYGEEVKFGGGKTIRDGIAFLGGDPARLDSARRPKGDAACYIELHIEQGGNLDKEKLNIGIVEGIVAIVRNDVTIEGFANHAGTTAMADRHDALLSASRFVDAVNRIVTATPGRQVGTVGRIQAFPGATNVIPGRVECTLELRDLDEPKLRRLQAEIRAEAEKIGAW